MLSREPRLYASLARTSAPRSLSLGILDKDDTSHQSFPHRLPAADHRDRVLVSVSVPEAVRGKNGEMHSMISNVEGENIRVTNNHLLLLHSILEEGQSVRDPP